MDITLSRHDILATTPAVPRTLAVLGMGANSTQKVAVGDLSGVLQCFSIKKGEVLVAFKTLPNVQEKVTCVTTGTGKTQKDKIFAAQSRTVRGTNNKGKDFFKFATNLTDDIHGLHVVENMMYAFTDSSVATFIESKDKDFYCAPDRINCGEVMPLVSLLDSNTVLACQDRTVRVLSGTNVLYETPVDGPATTVRYNPEPHDPALAFSGRKELLYGTDTGVFGQLMVGTDNVVKGAVVNNPQKLAGVRAIYSGFDVTKDGIDDIVVGREDGTVSVYDMDSNGALFEIFSTNFNECINTIDGGYITQGNVQDFIVHTFTGKVVALCQDGGGIMLPVDSNIKARYNMTAEGEKKYSNDIRMKQIRTEIGELRKKVEDEKRKYAAVAPDMVASAAVQVLKHRMQLDDASGCHVLTIECGSGMEGIALQSDLELQLLDVESNVAILSVSTAAAGCGSKTLATYRCQEATNRLEMRFIAREGQHGSVQAFVMPRMSPKTCEVITLPIKALCHHVPRHDAAIPVCMNTLTVTGTFSSSEMHGWLSLCVPDIPLRTDPAAPPSRFVHSTLGTVLTVQYRNGEAVFQSDSMATLSVLRETVAGQATAMNHRINLSFDTNPASIPHVLDLFWPKLHAQQMRKKNALLLAALAELRLQEEETACLSKHLRDVLANAHDIEAEQKRGGQEAENMGAVVRQLFIDWNKFAGVGPSKSKLPQLEQMLDDAHTTKNDLVNFFLGK